MLTGFSFKPPSLEDLIVEVGIAQWVCWWKALCTRYCQPFLVENMCSLLKSKIMRQKWLKNEKMNFCWDQEGHKGREIDLMNCAMNFHSYVRQIFFNVRSFSNFGIHIFVAFATILSLHFLFHFKIVRDVLMLPIFFQSKFVVITWHWCMTETQKILSVS